MTSWLMPALIVAAILVGQFVLLHQIGLFPVPATESGEKTLAAALVLIGTAVTAAVTLIGVVIKTSIDIRTANDTAIEANRTHLLALEGERRNRVDTVIRAVGLLGSDGKDATPHQISGALLALESLGEYDLAVALASHLWPHDLVSRRAVARVVRQAFTKGSPETQYAVAALLLENASKMPGMNRFLLWPLIDLSWPADALPVCRIALVMACLTAFKVELQRSRERVPGSAVVLFGALQDADAQIKNLAAAALRPFTDTMLETAWISTGTTALTVARIKAAVMDIGEPDSDPAKEIAEQIKALMADKALVVEPQSTSQAASSATWAYGVATVDPSKLTQIPELTAAGADGWEVVGAWPGEGATKMTLLKKRS